MIYKVLVTLLVLISFNRTISAQINDDFNGSVALGVSAGFTFGSQDKSIDFGVGIYTSGSFKKFAGEGGLNYKVNFFFQKFGVNNTSIYQAIEYYGLLGFGRTSNLLGASVGVNDMFIPFDEGEKGDFWGIGLGSNLNIISGSLKKFSNKQATMLIRVSNNAYTFNIVYANDVSVGIMDASGTDKALTGNLYIDYAYINNNALQSVGIALDMFTPEPDYSRLPRNLVNSSGGSYNVLYGTKPYENLFHGNLYLRSTYQTSFYRGELKLGVDSKKFGALVQNTLHDSFGLYPRFGWNIEEKDKLYIEFKGVGGIFINDSK